MFRLISRPLLNSRSLIVPQSFHTRHFSTTLVSFKKKDKPSSKKDKSHAKSNAKDNEDLEEGAPSVILEALESHYEDSLVRFKDRLTVVKQGKANDKIFDNLTVKLNHNETQQFPSIAQTSLKGRNLMITVFDPNNVKHVVSAILEAGLNLNPVPVPNFPQQLKVALPPITGEIKDEILKELKKTFIQFKTSVGFKQSLAAHRAEALKDLKEFKKTDEIRKATGDVEKLFKNYTTKLEDLLKTAEKQV